MQVTAFWCGVSLFAYVAVPAVLAVDRRPGIPERLVTSGKYHFSVVRPLGWFVYEGADVPVFFNFLAEDAPPQGQLPPGGASILLLLCQSRSGHIEVNSITTCAQQEAAVNRGISLSMRYIRGPVQASPALLVSFDQRGLGRIGETRQPSKHFVAAYWEYRGQPFGAELSYYKTDPKGSHYERDLLEMVRSFKPTQ